MTHRGRLLVFSRLALAAAVTAAVVQPLLWPEPGAPIALIEPGTSACEPESDALTGTLQTDALAGALRAVETRVGPCRTLPAGDPEAVAGVVAANGPEIAAARALVVVAAREDTEYARAAATARDRLGARLVLLGPGRPPAAGAGTAGAGPRLRWETGAPREGEAADLRLDLPPGVSPSEGEPRLFEDGREVTGEARIDRAAGGWRVAGLRPENGSRLAARFADRAEAALIARVAPAAAAVALAPAPGDRAGEVAERLTRLTAGRIPFRAGPEVPAGAALAALSVEALFSLPPDRREALLARARAGLGLLLFPDDPLRGYTEGEEALLAGISPFTPSRLAFGAGDVALRLIVVLLDTSQSMNFPSWKMEDARDDAVATLRALRDTDRFAVVTFGHEVRSTEETYSPRTADRAAQFLEYTTADGRQTRLLDALEEALRICAGEGNRAIPVRHVIVVSDGDEVPRRADADWQRLAARLTRERVTLTTVHIGERTSSRLSELTAAVPGARMEAPRRGELRAVFTREVLRSFELVEEQVRRMSGPPPAPPAGEGYVARFDPEAAALRAALDAPEELPRAGAYRPGSPAGDATTLFRLADGTPLAALRAEGAGFVGYWNGAIAAPDDAATGEWRASDLGARAAAALFRLLARPVDPSASPRAELAGPFRDGRRRLTITDGAGGDVGVAGAKVDLPGWTAREIGCGLFDLMPAPTAENPARGAVLLADGASIRFAAPSDQPEPRAGAAGVQWLRADEPRATPWPPSGAWWVVAVVLGLVHLFLARAALEGAGG
ncbi:MAG: VWA domain-containing protein [Planctomycetes bacterium]|nr:VWA domain-containing protein [Planctomycetota bacterium]